MSIESQSAATSPTAPAAQNVPSICPRCGMPLTRADVACNQRTCRPTALRRVTFVPLFPPECDADQEIENMHGGMLRIS
jgi:hypothetical protein